MPEPAEVICPKCGRQLPLDTPRGLCSRCLFAAMLDDGPLDGPPAPAQVAGPSALPQAFGAYELIEEIARGGMGIVYRARQVQLNRQVAIKVLASGAFAGPEFIKRFQIEAEAAASLSHPNIVPIHEVGEAEGQMFFSMRFVEGGSLASRLADPRARFPVRSAVELLIKLAHAVHFAHQRGILHRDIKPGNVLLDGRNEPFLTDFGLAKLIEEDNGLTRSMAVLGTPRYMPPEQARGEVRNLTTAVDIYGLGAVFYELITGQPPFAGDTTIETVRQVLECEPRRPRAIRPGLDRDLETICLKCLAKEPAGRYGSAEGLAIDLERWLRKEPILARPVGSLERGVKWIRRRPLLAALLGITLLAAAAVVVTLSLANVQIDAARRNEVKLRQDAEAKAEETRKHLVHANVARGNQLAGENDLFAALPPLVEALRLEISAPAPDIASVNLQRRRLGAVLRQAPALLGHWSLRDNETVRFSLDGKTLAVQEERKMRWFDASTGRETGPSFPLDTPATGVWFPQSDRMLVAEGAGRLRLWNTTNGEPVGVTMETRYAPQNTPAKRSYLDVSADGRWMLTSVKGGARVFDLTTGEPTGPVLAEGRPNFELRFSPKGDYAGISCGAGGFLLTEVPSGRVIWEAPINEKSFCGAFALSPDGRRLAIVSGRNLESLDLWDLSTNAPPQRLIKRSYIVQCRFTPDGRRVLAANASWVQVFDAETGQVIGDPVVHRSFVTSVTLTADGKAFAPTTYDNLLRVHEVATGRPLSPRFHHPGRVEQAQFGLDGQRLLTRSLGGTTRLWDLTGAAAVQRSFRVGGAVHAVEFSPDGRSILSCSGDRTAYVHEVETGRLVVRCAHPAPVVAGHFSIDGTRIVTGCTDGSVRIWNAEANGVPLASARHDKAVRTVCFSPDGRFILSGSDDKTARLWDATTGTPVGPPMKHSSSVWCAVFSPDGRQIATGAAKEANLWNVATGERLGAPLPHEHPVTAAAFTTDGRRIATAQRGSIQLFDTTTGQRHGPIAASPDVTSSLQISPDGHRILSASWLGSAAIFDLQNGLPLIPVLQHEKKVNAALFSPDGSMVLTCSEDGTARVWESATGQPVTPPLVHQGNVPCAAWSPNASVVATGSANGVVRLWDVSPTAETWESLRTTAELVSARRFQADAGAITLTADEIAQRWRQSKNP